MPRITIDMPADMAAEVARRADGIGKRRVILEAICKAWGWPTHDLPEDQRFTGSEAYEARKGWGWHEE